MTNEQKPIQENLPTENGKFAEGSSSQFDTLVSPRKWYMIDETFGGTNRGAKMHLADEHNMSLCRRHWLLNIDSYCLTDAEIADYRKCKGCLAWAN